MESLPDDDEPPTKPRRRSLSKVALRKDEASKASEASEASEASDCKKDTINLFLHDDNHYCVAKDLSRLVSTQLSKHKESKHICLQCLNAFGSEWTLSKHEELCSEHKSQHHAYPKPVETVQDLRTTT